MPKRIHGVLLGFGNLAAIVALILVQFPLLRLLPAAWGKLLLGTDVLLLYLAGARWIERRKAVELNPKDALRGLATAVPLGSGLFSSVIGMLWLAGLYEPSK